MSVLALGSYWLVRTAQPVIAPPAVNAHVHVPDYFMETFSTKSFDKDGRLHAELVGSAAHHYPDTQWTELETIALRSRDVQGRQTTASATRGLTNEDASELQLMGNAIVVRDMQAPALAGPAPGMEFRGEFLHIITKDERVKSHLPVELRRGADRFTADGMDYDNVTRVVQLSGRVHASLVPKPTSR
jgi:lipopolysaccharide export system protein LptC